jgi:acetoin utilization deacetylase AcuC-like enzyme
MKILFHQDFLNHNIRSDFEGPYRLKGFEGFPNTESYDGERYLDLVHTREYIDYIKSCCEKEMFLAEVKITRETYNAACHAVGLTVKASEKGDFAVVRPPGHHAAQNSTSGFCLFNNVAIAAQKLVNEGDRVCIVDIDGHHGDGTQKIFYDSPSVMYASIHQQNAFPFTGAPVEQGEGEGVGKTLNVPLYPGQGHKDFLNAMDKIINAVRYFDPDVIAVSAGFDGYKNDRILELNYSLSTFYEAGYQLKKAFRYKKIFAVLEGGYHEHVKSAIEKFVEGINKGAKPPRIKYDPNMAIG